MNYKPTAISTEQLLRLDTLAMGLACAANVPFLDKRLTSNEVAVLAALFKARLDWWQCNLSDEELENIRQMHLGPVTC